ncbi:type VI secretion system Vgr family protein [Paragemmobacter straminiformis]|uniref:Type VI secretion system tip protein VgrG n=1 Tax=Paragemmobacter straminiformis TaxID=2045119 RepID=A0A842IBH2_9RHOB|nr:type VI secretion system tip protein TssI/VgrG [Gemmobacter straminiformis]MBC2836444.1 type VI secretion system tip protein VgrG [Gemmobacter straminiformis]
MTAKQFILENRDVVLYAPMIKGANFTRAVIDEGLSEPMSATVEFAVSDRDLDYSKILGRELAVRVAIGEEKWRDFRGIAFEIEYIGMFEGLYLYSVQLRSWLWLLTLSKNNRVFQDLSLQDIVKRVIGDYGQSDFEFKTSREYKKRPYTIQHNETDFDFLSRLLEEEGMYYFSNCENGKEKIFFVDGIGGHTTVPEAATIKYYEPEPNYRRTVDHIFDWISSEQVTTGKVTLSDYNFETPKSDLTTKSAQPKGSHGNKDREHYVSPGKYRDTEAGNTFARIQMEAIAARHTSRRAVCNVPTMAVGFIFDLDQHPRSTENAAYLVTRARHLVQIEPKSKEMVDALGMLHGRLPNDPDNYDRYRSQIEVLPKTSVFRAERKVPWPQIPGLMIAKVVGPKGEEIFTDKYGRIKVQFPWDREGKNDDHSSCFVRCVMPWVGNKWGMVSIPRIGQEVVIQFEDGNPDRPICTGMLYNADNMPPYDLPANKTQTGIKTNTSAGGGGFNELMFEDKKGEELVRMQAEKDFTQIVKNNATVTIGIEKKDAGNLTQTIQNHLTETLKAGDHTFTVEAGKETRKIAKDQTEEVGANRKKDITGDSTETVGGNEKLDVTGNREITVTGNQKTSITGTETTETTGTADWKVKGPITIESNASITLKVGGSQIVISPLGVTVEGMSIKTDAKMAAEHSGGLSMVVKGLMVNIN